MKIRILVTIIGAATLAAITFQVNAGNALLTPRAAGNQIQVAPGTTEAQPAAAVPAITPRAAGNEPTTVKGVEATPAQCPVMGTPKSQSLAGSSARTSCCGQTVAACPFMTGCGGAK
jgi:hypothetical protein